MIRAGMPGEPAVTVTWCPECASAIPAADDMCPGCNRPRMADDDTAAQPGTWGYVTVAVRPDDTHELRPAYVDDTGAIVYTPGFDSAWRDAPAAIADTWRFWHPAGQWRRWVPVAGTVIVDGPSFTARRVGE